MANNCEVVSWTISIIKGKFGLSLCVLYIIVGGTRERRKNSRSKRGRGTYFPLRGHTQTRKTKFCRFLTPLLRRQVYNISSCSSIDICQTPSPLLVHVVCVCSLIFNQTSEFLPLPQNKECCVPKWES